VNLGDIVAGKVHAACDHQNLTAPFPAADPAAAVAGEVAVPLNLLYEGEREYCFRDDNGESHELTIATRGGAELTRITSGGECAKLTLAPGRYLARLRHERPGVTDLPHNNVHTFTERSPTGTPRLVFATNELRGGVISGPWPRLNSRENGYSGNYAGTTFQDSRCDDPGANCSLHGTFDGATFTGAGQAWNLTLDGSFLNVELHHLWVNHRLGTTAELIGTFSGAPFDGPSRVLLWNRPKLSSTFVQKLATLETEGRGMLLPDDIYNGTAVVRGGSVASVVDVDVLLESRGIAFDGVDVKLPLLRAGAPADLTDKEVTVLRSRVHDGQLDGQGGKLTVTDGVLENVVLAPPERGGKRPASWQTPALVFQSTTHKTTIRNVRVSSDGVNSSADGPWTSSVYATNVDIDGFEMSHAFVQDVRFLVNTKAKDVSFSNGQLTTLVIDSSAIDGLDISSATVHVGTFNRATIPRGSFRKARLDRQSTNQLLRVSDSTFGRALDATSASFAGSEWRRSKIDLSAPGAVFTDAKLLDVLSFGPELSGATMLRVELSFGVPYSAPLALSAPYSVWSDARITGAVFDGASFAEARMERVVCRSCQALGASFSAANLDGATFGESTTVFDRARLSHASLRGAVLHGSAKGAIFDDADLSTADVTGLKLDNASAADALFCGAKMAGVSLTSADVFRARVRSTSQACLADADGLASVVTDDRTTCPDGSLGPCTGTTWDVREADQCCKPNTGQACPKTKVSGAPCNHRCDCQSLVCTNRICG